jgi:hypothetical protein
MYQAAIQLFAGSIERLDLSNHFFVKRKYIARLDIGRFVLLNEQERIASPEQPFEDRLFSRIQRDGHGGALHGRSEREKWSQWSGVVQGSPKNVRKMQQASASGWSG